MGIHLGETFNLNDLLGVIQLLSIAAGFGVLIQKVQGLIDVAKELKKDLAEHTTDRNIHPDGPEILRQMSELRRRHD